MIKRDEFHQILTIFFKKKIIFSLKIYFYFYLSNQIIPNDKEQKGYCGPARL
jgi:hypothetical protein